MSSTIYETGSVTLGTFAGGIKRGPCFQITTPEAYVQLTYADAEAIANAILRELGKFHGVTP
jgi:hypothetical protein